VFYKFTTNDLEKRFSFFFYVACALVSVCFLMFFFLKKNPHSHIQTQNACIDSIPIVIQAFIFYLTLCFVPLLWGFFCVLCFGNLFLCARMIFIFSGWVFFFATPFDRNTQNTKNVHFRIIYPNPRVHCWCHTTDDV
jgi:hypothetical protein